MVCQSCGFALESWYRFCPHCGAVPGTVKPKQAGLTLLGAYAKMWKNFAVFRGRASRQEYWYVYLVQNLILLAGMLMMLLPWVIGILCGNEGSLTVVFVMAVAILLYMLVAILPNIAIMVRRLHDTGKSGWFHFLNLIPYVGSIVMIVLLAQDSQPGANQYGPNPKGK